MPYFETASVIGGCSLINAFGWLFRIFAVAGIAVIIFLLLRMAFSMLFFDKSGETKSHNFRLLAWAAFWFGMYILASRLLGACG